MKIGALNLIALFKSRLQNSCFSVKFFRGDSYLEYLKVTASMTYSIGRYHFRA